MNNYFIAIYTNTIKDYCDEKFFSRVYELSQGNPVHIVDNTIGIEYYNTLLQLCKYDNFHIHHIDVPIEPMNSQAGRNILASANYLRDKFLLTDIPRFLIMESDVIPPSDVLDRFDNTIESLPQDWGMLGAIYYNGFGFHNLSMTGVHKKNHVLSGCTVYKRALIEKYPFRYNENDLNNFPDALMSFDSNKEFALYDNHDIRCEHVEASNGTRYSKTLIRKKSGRTKYISS